MSGQIPMKRIREVLLTQYIGAIAIGLIMAQAVIVFIGGLMNAVATYWAMLQSGRSVFSGNPGFPWTNIALSSVSSALHFGVAIVFVRWLYGGPKVESDSSTPGDSE